MWFPLQGASSPLLCISDRAGPEPFWICISDISGACLRHPCKMLWRPILKSSACVASRTRRRGAGVVQCWACAHQLSGEAEFFGARPALHQSSCYFWFERQCTQSRGLAYLRTALPGAHLGWCASALGIHNGHRKPIEVIDLHGTACSGVEAELSPGIQTWSSSQAPSPAANLDDLNSS